MIEIVKDFLRDLFYLLGLFLEETHNKVEFLVEFLTKPEVYAILLGLVVGTTNIDRGIFVAVAYYIISLFRLILVEMISIENNLMINSRNQVKTYALLSRLLGAINNIPIRSKKNKDG